MRKSFLGTIIIGLLLIGSMVLAYSSGPPDGRTGAPSESNCSVTCHNSFNLNSGSGLLQIVAPTTYSAGEVIDIDIKLSQQGQDRWGFEITVLDASNNPVGDLSLSDAVNTQKSTAISSRQYIKHTTFGTFNNTANASPGWTLRWTAPNVDAGPVTFYAAGNAADGNTFNNNDFIYTTSHTLTADIPECCVGIRGNINGLDGEPGIDISDVVYFVNFIFKDGPGIDCLEEADVDANGGADVSDLVYMVNFVFKDGPIPLSCQ